MLFCMSSFQKIHLTVFVLVFVGLSFSTEAKADVVSLNLMPTNYDIGNGVVRVRGSYTNSGNLTFQANDVHVVFPPGVGLTGFGAIPNDGSFYYALPVPGLSSTPVIPLLDFFFANPTPQGTYTFTLTVS